MKKRKTRGAKVETNESCLLIKRSTHTHKHTYVCVREASGALKNSKP
ncbi:hypothetical protein HanLR1_Chr11g0389471 [Helianthus annuus]|nr:hypothetical protein HanHA89_Chr15g0634221 [Helianthus annuus]KAJ0684283.1 hypothetical protein HanLR1_Chr11g0389471 [Helianthus annuus]